MSFCCRGCGFSSETRAFFAPATRRGADRTALFCPVCRPVSVARRQVITTAIFLILLVAAFGALASPSGLGGDDAFPMLGASAFIIGLPLMVLVHEAGHAAAAVAVGSWVFSISLGRGALAWRRRVAGTDLELRGGFVMTGAVVHGPRRATRWKLVFILLAGAMANLAAGLGLLALGDALFSASDPIEFLEENDAPAILAPIFIGVALAQVVGLFNLVPCGASDGSQIIQLFRRPLALELARQSHLLLTGVRLMEQERFHELRDLCDEAWKEGRRSASLLANLLAGIGESDGPAAAIACFNARRDLIADTRQDDPAGWAVLNANAAWYLMQSDDEALRGQADTLSARAVEALPAYKTLTGIRGAVLGTMNQWAPAKALLEEALAHASYRREKFLFCQQLALAEHALGRDDIARSYARLSERFVGPA